MTYSERRVSAPVSSDNTVSVMRLQSHSLDCELPEGRALAGTFLFWYYKPPHSKSNGNQWFNKREEGKERLIFDEDKNSKKIELSATSIKTLQGVTVVPARYVHKTTFVQSSHGPGLAGTSAFIVQPGPSLTP